MEGILYKWTNYWNALLAEKIIDLLGWQPRWFTLDEGLLSYYTSQEEVKQGCKGTVHLSACEIIVHPKDTLRVDVVIPSEQHFYLKAPSSQERHAWLVALGNAKAGLPPSIPKPKLEKIHSEKTMLVSKKSELQLTCNLLMKQVYDVKTATSASNELDKEKLEESTSLLSATCDSFIKTLEECMQLVDESLSSFETGEVVTAPITVLTKERKPSRSSTPSFTRQSSSEK